MPEVRSDGPVGTVKIATLLNLNDGYPWKF